MSKSKILFQMSGSIACFKACQIVSKLAQAGHQVQAVASQSALKFVGQATLEGLTGLPVAHDLFARGQVMDHIHLVRWADLIICAPATADLINKMASGVADDLLSTQFLAHDFKKPYLVAPAMNTAMYLHPVTQKSISRLREIGIGILETASGVLACGEVGWGRLLDPDLIVKEIETALKQNSEAPPEPTRTLDVQANSPRVLITTGGTREAIDAVRFIGNRSSGKTGFYLAEQFSQLGFQVLVLAARDSVPTSVGMQIETFESFDDLSDLLEKVLRKNHFDFVVHAAAVSDFSVLRGAKKNSKIESSSSLTLNLKPNPKLIGKIAGWSKNKSVKIFGFKLTVGAKSAQIKKSVEKVFNHKNVVGVIHNDTSQISSTQHAYRISSNADDSDLNVLQCPDKSSLTQGLLTLMNPNNSPGGKT